MDYAARRTVVSKEFLYELFLDSNIVIDDVVVNTRVNRRRIPFSFALVTLRTRKLALRAIKKLNYTKLNNVPIRLSIYDAEAIRARRTGEGNLIIRNLDQSVDEAQLYYALAGFGEIISCVIPTVYNSDIGVMQSRGYGFVHFRNTEDAQQVMSQLNGASVNGNKVTIEPARYHRSFVVE